MFLMFVLFVSHIFTIIGMGIERKNVMPILVEEYVHGRASNTPSGMVARSHRGISGNFEKLGMHYPVSPPQGWMSIYGNIEQT